MTEGRSLANLEAYYGFRPTLCQECDNVYPASRKQSEWQWKCTKHKRLFDVSFISGADYTEAPYLLCRDVNAGMCPLFTPLKTQQTET